MLNQNENPKGGHHRKNCLLGFIEKCLDNPSLHHLIRWCDEAAGLFQVLWVHAGRSSYHKKTHGSLFDLYREYRGRGITSDPKQAFRMALKKSPCIRATLSGSRDWRTFRIIRKCHKVCSSAETKQTETRPLSKFEKRVNLEDSPKMSKMKANDRPFQDSFTEEDFGVFVKEDKEDIVNDWKNKNDNCINKWNNLFPRNDSEINTCSEVSLLDFLDSLPTASDDINFKTTPDLSPMEENYNSYRYDINPSFEQSMQNLLDEPNPPYENFDFNHPITMKGVTTFNHGLWIKESDIQKNRPQDLKMSDNTFAKLDTSTLSPPPKELSPRPPSCCPSNEYPCRCLHYHVSTKEHPISEILPLDSVGLSSWILASPSNYNENNSGRCHNTQSTDYNTHIPFSSMKSSSRSFNDVALEIESIALSRLLEDEQNHIDAMLNPSNLFYSEPPPRNNCFNDYAAQAKNEVESPLLSRSYLSHLNQQNNHFTSWSPTPNFVPSETSKFSGGSILAHDQSNLGKFDNHLISYSELMSD